jgi:hypothetical protein
MVSVGKEQASQKSFIDTWTSKGRKEKQGKEPIISRGLGR